MKEFKFAIEFLAAYPAAHKYQLQLKKVIIVTNYLLITPSIDKQGLDSGYQKNAMSILLYSYSFLNFYFVK